MLAIRVVSMAMLFVLTTIPNAQAQECKQLDSATPDEWVSYLNQVTRDDQSRECIYFALRGLGSLRWESAVETLVKFLDFRRPLNAGEKAGESQLEDPYPAVAALTSLRQRALPAVLMVMQSDSASELAKHNAVVVWMHVYWGVLGDSSKAVAMLAREVEKAPTETTKQRLREAVVDAVKYCPPEDKAKCQAASELRKVTGTGR